MKNKLTVLVLHCTATPAGRNVTPDDIRKWHTDPVDKGGRGWKQVGYSDIIMLDGSLINLVKYNDDDVVDPWEITNGILKTDGVFYNSRHVVYVGGCDKKMQPLDSRTVGQLKTMTDYVIDTIRKHPSIKIAGHNQFAKKACPSFSVPSWLRSIGVEDKNIYDEHIQ